MVNRSRALEAVRHETRRQTSTTRTAQAVPAQCRGHQHRTSQYWVWTSQVAPGFRPPLIDEAAPLLGNPRSAEVAAHDVSASSAVAGNIVLLTPFQMSTTAVTRCRSFGNRLHDHTASGACPLAGRRDGDHNGIQRPAPCLHPA